MTSDWQPRCAPTCRKFAEALVQELPDCEYANMKDMMMNSARDEIWCGTIFSGSEYCHEALIELLEVLREGFGLPTRFEIRIVMAVEIEPWKRSWIMKSSNQSFCSETQQN